MKEDIVNSCCNEEYNDEPVYFCAHCLSLAIKETNIGDCCMDCGSMIIRKASLREYDDIYEAKYNKRVFYK